MRFRVQNAPYPVVFFCEASRELERNLWHNIWRYPSSQFLLTWRYFVTAGAKSNQNHIEIACVNGPLLHDLNSWMIWLLDDWWLMWLWLINLKMLLHLTFVFKESKALTVPLTCNVEDGNSTFVILSVFCALAVHLPPLQSGELTAHWMWKMLCVELPILNIASRCCS